MSTQHTPGPWTRTPEERFKHDGSAGIKGPNGNYLAAALDFNRTDRDDEVEANARLIAAAPELLAACIEAEWNLRQGAIDPDDLKRIRAAIAKAKGHTP